MTGTAFCGNSPVDPTLLRLVRNEVLNLDDDVCQNKEQTDRLKSQLSEVKQKLEQLLQLPQKVEQVEQEVETLKQEVAELSRTSVKRHEKVNPSLFFGALDRNEYFTGREKELESLDKAFVEANTTGGNYGMGKRKAKIHGICGLGGCGKSSLAFEYAWRNLERYPGGVFVLNGESDDLLRASLQEIHEQFVRNTHANKDEEAKQFNRLMTETLSWLGNLRRKWLLLVDNMDQKELSSFSRKLFFGQWKNKSLGDILVTSRRNSQALLEDLVLLPENCLELDSFSVDESAEFLKKRTGLPSCVEDQVQGVKQLARELGGLPLALEQAAAYINALKCSVQSYLKQYREQKLILLNRRRAKPCSEIYNEARLAVQTTWRLNLNYIENDENDEGLGKAAVFFMKIATHLSPEEIPIEILNVGAPEIDNKCLKNRLKMPIGAKQIVDLLLRFSLFKRKSDDSLSIHRLVLEMLRESYDGVGETEEVFSSAIRMLHYAFLDCVGGTDCLHDLHMRLDSAVVDFAKSNKHKLCQSFFFSDNIELNSRRWKMLSVNAFHLLAHLLENLSLQCDCLLREETARLFCEAAYYCYSLGMDSEGYHLQQFVFEILCTMKKSICFYKGDELMKITRILMPFKDASARVTKSALSFVKSIEKFIDGTDVPVDTNRAKKKLEEIEMIEQKAREAFSRGDFQISCDLFTDIVKLSVAENQPNARALGSIFCNRGIANLKMENFETAVDDFNESISADTEHYRGYYWKVYALCKLVQNGRIEFTSRAQAAAAVLHFKFAHFKQDDIHKLQHKFQGVKGLLDKIYYKFITHVNQIKELESEFPGKLNSNDPFTVILADGKYDLNKIVISKGYYYFVCLPGSSAKLMCNEGLFLSNGTFLFENVSFENSLPSEGDQLLSSASAGCTAQKEELLSITFGTSNQAKTEVTACKERQFNALIKANGVKSLVIEHCSLANSNCAGVMVEAQLHQRVIVSVRSSVIMLCNAAGIIIQGGTADSHISICNSDISHNVYGIMICSPGHFYVENSSVSHNKLGGFVASGGRGGLLRNSLSNNARNAILLQGSNAAIEENFISENSGWGIVCCAGSNLACKQTTLGCNYCGGLRIVLNGRGNVVVEKCEFWGNRGPDVFPSNAKEICSLELKCKQLFTSPQEFPIVFYLRYFLKLDVAVLFEYAGEFESPLLLDNRVFVVSHFHPGRPVGLCSSCRKDFQLNSDWVECPSCHVARYCSQHCFYTAKASHSFVCNCILEPNKQCEPLLPLTTSPVKALLQREAGISLCVVVAVNASPKEFCKTIETDSTLKISPSACLLTCPQRNLFTVLNSLNIHNFVMIYGSPIQESMLDIKAASILANFDPESDTVTVYMHRIFPVDKVPGAWNWVNRSLDLFAKSCLKGDT